LKLKLAEAFAKMLDSLQELQNAKAEPRLIVFGVFIARSLDKAQPAVGQTEECPFLEPTVDLQKLSSAQLLEIT